MGQDWGLLSGGSQWEFFRAVQGQEEFHGAFAGWGSLPEQSRGSSCKHCEPPGWGASCSIAGWQRLCDGGQA